MAMIDDLNKAEARTAELEASLQRWTGNTESNIKFYAEKVEDRLSWLEGEIRNLRHAMETGHIFEQVNLIRLAGEVADYAGKLRSMHEWLGVLKDIEASE